MTKDQIRLKITLHDVITKALQEMPVKDVNDAMNEQYILEMRAFAQ